MNHLRSSWAALVRASSSGPIPGRPHFEPSGVMSGDEAQRWASGSALPGIYYYGTRNLQRTISTGVRPGEDMRYGEGVYLSPIPNPSPAFVSGVEGVVEVRVRVSNPLRGIRTSEMGGGDVIDALIAALGLQDKYSTDYYASAMEMERRGMPYEDGVNWCLRQSGHDALVLNDARGRDIVMVPDPSKVRVVRP